ncbi:MAG: DMT family transporter [Bacillota bacterium]
MRPQDVARLLALGAMWGASYLFMRYAVPHFGPILMIELRVLIAGVALLAFVLATGGRIAWAKHWRAYLFVGAVGLAAPFVLIGQALTTIDASTAAILNALAPLFAAVTAAWWIRDPLTPAKMGGIALCIAGTALLVGWSPTPPTSRELFAAGLMVLATALYGYTIVFTKVHLREANPSAISAATLLVAAATLAPFAPGSHNVANVPSMAWLAVLGLALVSTTVAFILYYRLIADIGPVKAITVTLLVPVFGMMWGIVFLGEPLSPGRIVGCAVILAGCASILGLVRMPVRATT